MDPMKKLIAIVLFFWGVLPSVSGAAERKLVWTYPCTFKYIDTTEPLSVSNATCDFTRTLFDNDATQKFNGYTPAAQATFLNQVGTDSDAAYKVYQDTIQKILKATDPATLSPKLSQVARLKKLMEFQSILFSPTTIASFKPFQWEHLEPNSYLDKRGGIQPSSWDPYLSPLFGRAKQLDQLIHPLQRHMVDTAAMKVTNVINTLEELKKTHPTAEQLLARIWGGTFESPGSSILSLVGLRNRKAPAALPAMTPQRPTRAMPPPLPLPLNREAQAHYQNFARGFEEGMKRVHKEESIAWWHYTGQTQTVGDPVGKSSLAFQQKAATCAPSAEFQALKARGVIPNNTAMHTFVEQAQKNGLYFEIRDKAGRTYGGTPTLSIDKMLTVYHFPHILMVEAKPIALDRAVLQSGDAIVVVYANTFYKNPNININATHAIYVTGAEVDKTGKVVGYYFNDTATGEGARYISVADFRAAWTHVFVRFNPPNGN